MNKKFFIRYETPDGSSWTDAIASLNTYLSEDGILQDHSQLAQRYRRADYKMSIFKTLSETPSSFLSIGFPTNISDQTVTIQSVDTDLIITKLNTGKYQSVYFAFYFGDNPDGAGDLDAVNKSGYYARNTETGYFENLTSGAVISEVNPKFSFWYCVSKIGNTDIYYMVLNPEMTTVTYDVDGTFNNTEYMLLNNHDGSFANAVFKPSVSGGELVNDSIIVATSNSITVDTLGKSAIHGFTGTKIPKDQLPVLNLDIQSSVPYTVDNNLVTLDISSKSVSYVKIKWITDSNLDFPMISSTESITESFVIIKE